MRSAAIGGAAWPGRRSRRQQRARTERQHDLVQRSRRLRQHRRRRWLTGLHRGAGRYGGRRRHAGARPRTGWRGDRNSRGQIWSQASEHANSSTASWWHMAMERGMFFAEAELGLMISRRRASRALLAVGRIHGWQTLTALGRGRRRLDRPAASHRRGWLIQPSVGFCALRIPHLGSVGETGAALAENIGAAPRWAAPRARSRSLRKARSSCVERDRADDCRGSPGGPHESAAYMARAPASFRLVFGGGGSRVPQRADRA